MKALHERFVLVPADKAANNVIIVCKKYYLDAVLRELESTSTYKEVCSNSDSVVDRHVDYMMRNGLAVVIQRAKQHRLGNK